MNILIVGGNSALAKTLIPILSKSHKISTAGRSYCDFHIDLVDSIENIKIPDGIDVVINTSAAFLGNNFEQIYNTESVNAIGALKLCEACNKAKVKHLVMISSIFVHLFKDSPQFNIYALSKKHSDELAQLYCKNYELPLTILRPSQFYGCGPEQLKNQPFLSSIISKISNNEDITLYGSNDAKRNFIHVEDLAHIISEVINKKILGTFDCPGPSNVSYSELIQSAIRAFKSKSVLKFDTRKPNIPDNIFDIDNTLYNIIEFTPQITIKVGMEKEALYRSKYNWPQY